MDSTVQTNKKKLFVFRLLHFISSYNCQVTGKGGAIFFGETVGESTRVPAISVYAGGFESHVRGRSGLSHVDRFRVSLHRTTLQ